MADQYTPEEIAGIFEAYNNAIKTGTPITQEMADAMKDAQKGVKGFAAAQRQLFSALGKSVADITKAMYKGEQGAKGLADSVETVTTALTTLSFLVGGPLVKAISLVTMGLFKFGKVAAEQSDQLFKTYKDLSQSGAAAAGGMTDVFNNMQKFGYGLEQLDQMTAIIKENSEALASFGGTAASGTQAFADAAAQIQRTNLGRELQYLGKMPDDINRGMAMFIKQQQQSGMTNSQINQNLAQRSAEYIKNLDTLSKLTGEDAARLQQKLDEAMAEDAFNQTIYELRKRQAAGDIEAGKLANEYENAARRLTGEALKEFQQGVGGDISAMSKTMMTSANAVSLIGNKAFTASGYIDALAQGAVQSRDAFGGLAKFNATRDFILPMKELSLAESRYAEVTAKNQEDLAQAQQQLQIKGLDPATKAQVELRIAQMQGRDALQSFVNLGVKPATQALEKLSKGAAGVAKLAPGEVATDQGIGGGSANVTGAIRNRTSQTTQTQKQFVDTMYNTLLEEAKKQGVKNPEVIAKLGTAQSALETGYGRSLAGGQNYFGIKARPGEGGPGVATKEYIDGKMVTINDRFRRYGSMQESAADYIKFLQENKRYKDVLAAGSLEEAIAAQSRTGYATDPNYGRKLSGIADRITGPAGGYDNKMAMVKPETTLPSKETPGSAQTMSQANDSDSILAALTSKLDSLDRRMSDVADNTKKTAQYAGS